MAGETLQYFASLLKQTGRRHFVLPNIEKYAVVGTLVMDMQLLP